MSDYSYEDSSYEEHNKKKLNPSFTSPCERDVSWINKPKIKKMVVDELMDYFIGDETSPHNPWEIGAENIMVNLGPITLYRALDKTQQTILKKKLNELRDKFLEYKNSKGFLKYPELRSVNFQTLPDHKLKKNFDIMGPDFMIAYKETIKEVPKKVGIFKLRSKKMEFHSFLRDVLNKSKKQKLCEMKINLDKVTGSESTSSILFKQDFEKSFPKRSDSQFSNLSNFEKMSILENKDNVEGFIDSELSNYDLKNLLDEYSGIDGSLGPSISRQGSEPRFDQSWLSRQSNQRSQPSWLSRQSNQSNQSKIGRAHV